MAGSATSILSEAQQQKITPGHSIHVSVRPMRQQQNMPNQHDDDDSQSRLSYPSILHNGINTSAFPNWDANGSASAINALQPRVTITIGAVPTPEMKSISESVVWVTPPRGPLDDFSNIPESTTNHNNSINADINPLSPPIKHPLDTEDDDSRNKKPRIAAGPFDTQIQLEQNDDVPLSQWVPPSTIAAISSSLSPQSNPLDAEFLKEWSKDSSSSFAKSCQQSSPTKTSSSRRPVRDPSSANTTNKQFQDMLPTKRRPVPTTADGTVPASSSIPRRRNGRFTKKNAEDDDGQMDSLTVPGNDRNRAGSDAGSVADDDELQDMDLDQEDGPRVTAEEIDACVRPAREEMKRLKAEIDAAVAQFFEFKDLEIQYEAQLANQFKHPDMLAELEELALRQTERLESANRRLKLSVNYYESVYENEVYRADAMFTINKARLRNNMIDAVNETASQLRVEYSNWDQTEYIPRPLNAGRSLDASNTGDAEMLDSSSASTKGKKGKNRIKPGKSMKVLAPNVCTGLVGDEIMMDLAEIKGIKGIDVEGIVY